MNFRRLVKKFMPSNSFHVFEPYGHLAEAIVLNALNGFPTRKLKVIGVTGTNGKTTTSFLVHKMLLNSGYKVGLMTTVAYGAGDNIVPQMEHMTNSSVPVFMKRIKDLRKQGIEWLVLETTSQGLAQSRVWGVPYSLVVMTNVTHEHLDYHKTFERYRAAKVKMFQMCNRNRRGLRTGIINAEDPSAKFFEQAITHSLFYGVEKGDLRATNVSLKPSGVSYNCSLEGTNYHIDCKIPGSFNVYNSLATVAVGHKLGLSKQQIEQGINSLEGVEGRMTRIDQGQEFSVIVDFAHTPDSFEKLLKDMRPVVKGKLIAMFGSAGRRDEEKRAAQGKLAGEYADEVILTEEDDRDIDGNSILNDIASGAKSAGKTPDKDLFLVLDRTEAIAFALRRATNREDVVLLLGKGHEKTIERADGDHPWNESEVTKKQLDLLLGKH